MKYKGLYFWLFYGTMKKVLAEKYNTKYAKNIMQKSRRIYRSLVENADDIGDDNPMAYNELFALAFVAPYIASDKKIPPETIQEMMRHSLYHMKWYFGMTNLNTEKGKRANKKNIIKYVDWYTPDKEKNTQRHLRLTLSGNRIPMPATIGLPVARSALIAKSLACRN